MTTYYARSTLVNMSDTTGWSLTSGGPSAGVTPGFGSDLVFDANSGAARSIAASLNARSFTTVGAAAMAFTGTIDAYEGINLTGTASVSQLNTGTGLVIAPGVAIDLLLAGRAGTVAGSNLTAKAFRLGSSAGDTFDSSSFDMTFGDVYAATTSTILYMGTGTWTLTGEGAAFYGGAPRPDVWNVTSNVQVYASGTIKFVSAIAAQLTFNGKTRNFNNVWNATSGNGMRFTGTDDTFANFRIEPGSLTEILAGKTVKAASFTLDGMGVMTTLRGSSASGYLESTSATLVSANYCNLQNLAGVGAIATYRALNSVNLGNVSNFTFVPNNSRFLQFF